MLQRVAQTPVLTRIEIHAKGMGQARASARVLQVLAFVEDIGALAQTPALTQRESGALAVVEQAVVLRRVCGDRVGTVEAVLGRQLVLARHGQRIATAAMCRFATDRGLIAKQIARASRHRIVVAVLAAVVVQRGLTNPVQLQRGADALAVLECRQCANALTAVAVFIDAAHFSGQGALVIHAPFGGQLGLRQ